MPPTVQLARERTYADIDGTRTLIAVPGQPVPQQFRDLISDEAVEPAPVFLTAEELDEARAEIQNGIEELTTDHAATLERLQGEHAGRIDELIGDVETRDERIAQLTEQLAAAVYERDAARLELEESKNEGGQPKEEPDEGGKAKPADGNKAKPGPEHDKARRGARTKAAAD